MRKSAVRRELASLYKKLGKAPGWKALKSARVDESDICAHWDSLADALDASIEGDWRGTFGANDAADLSREEEPARAGAHFSVYVIRLNEAVMDVGRFAKKNPKGTKDCFYVGSTWHSPAARFQNHQRGHRACPLVKKYGEHLVQKLTQDGKFHSRDEAEAEERRLARELRRDGYRVWQK